MTQPKQLTRKQVAFFIGVARSECIINTSIEDARELGVSLTDLFMLLKVQQHEWVTSNSLYIMQEFSTKETVKAQLHRLIKKGYITKYRVKGEPEVRYYLGEKGKELLMKMGSVHARHYKKYRSHYENERKRIWSNLRTSDPAAQQGYRELEDAEEGTDVPEGGF